jgi:hypothetical protein
MSEGEIGDKKWLRERFLDIMNIVFKTKKLAKELNSASCGGYP